MVGVQTYTHTHTHNPIHTTVEENPTSDFTSNKVESLVTRPQLLRRDVPACCEEPAFSGGANVSYPLMIAPALLAS